MLEEVFFTSDTHFDHANMIKYAERPFRNIEEMADTMIRNWNNVVGKRDLVYHLGDFAFCKEWRAREILTSLNGRIILLHGSHDKVMADVRDCLYEYYPRYHLLEVKLYGQIITLGHCPMLSWEKKFHGALHAFGHVHTAPNKVFYAPRNSYDVGVDNNNFTPVLFEDFVRLAKDPTNKLETMLATELT